MTWSDECKKCCESKARFELVKERKGREKKREIGEYKFSHSIWGFLP
jgi:hypothetical protein